ncbi:MAG TPA: GNAT family N-acetyltransferase [Opitutaceae bacterium]|nr:GNAT family N-acetyltransferase [Opitutaceae bacterium]
MSRLNSIELIWPAVEYLPGYVAALKRGWSPDNIRGEEAAREQLEAIAKDPGGFVAGLVDREAKQPPIRRPDGSSFPRLPGFIRWIWDGEFCGSIGFRWQPGTSELPPYVLGHIGYAVVPWKRNLGYATQALRETLPLARAEGLDWVDLTTDETNSASIRVIEANGGKRLEHFMKPAVYGGQASLRYRITL